MRNYVLCGLLSILSFSMHAQSTMFDTEPESLYRHGLDLLQKSDYAAAREVFDKYIEEGSDDLKKTDAEYYAAYSALILYHRDGEKRLERFIKEHKSHPKASVAYFELGDFYFKQKKYSQAIDYLEKVDYTGLTNDQKATAQFELGYSYFTKRNFDDALPQFDALKRRKSKYQAAASYYAGYIHYQEGNYDEALVDLRRAGENPSYSAIVPGMIAAIYYNQKRYDDLIAYSKQVLSSGKKVNEGEFYLLTADAYLHNQNFQAAAENYSRYTAKSKNPALPVRYRIGYTAFQLEDYETAVDQFKRVAGKSDSTGAYASYYLGILYLKQGEKLYAQNAFKAAKGDYYPMLNEESSYQYAKVTYDLGQTMPAIDAMTAFQQEFPSSRHSEEIGDLLSQAYLNTKNYDLAISRIEAYQGNLPASLRAVYQKASFLQGAEYFNKEEYRKALASFEKAKRYTEDARYSALTYLWAGETYAVQGQHEEAIRNYRKALEGATGEEALAARYGLAYSLYNTQKYDQALKYFRSYVDAGSGTPFYGDAMLRLADCYYVEKEYNQAIRYYQDASNANPGDKDYALLQLAVVNGIEGNLQEALRGYQQLLKEFPRSRYYDDAVYQRAQLNFENGQFEEAIRGFSRLVREKPRSQFVPYAYLKRATAYYNLQQYDRCINDYETLLEQYPKHSATGEALLPMQEVLNAEGRSAEFSNYLARYKAANPDGQNLQAIEFETAKNLYYNLEYQQAITAFETYVKTYPRQANIPEARYLTADSYYRLSQYAQAKTLYESLLGETQLPQYNRVLSRLASIESLNGDRAEAIRRYNQLASAANNKKELYNAWAGLMENHFENGGYDSARFYAKEILTKAQVNVSAENKAHLYTGKSEAALGNLDAAMQEFRITRDNARDQFGAEAQYLIGELQYKSEEYDSSIETLISMNDGFGAYQEWIGKAYLLLSDNYVAKEDLFQAKGTLNSIIDNFPDEGVKEQARRKLGIIEAMEETEQEEVIIESDSLEIID